MNAPARAWVALGANLGDARRALVDALAALAALPGTPPATPPAGATSTPPWRWRRHCKDRHRPVLAA